jgi:thioredoxin-dependent peroxiredoxin
VAVSKTKKVQVGDVAPDFTLPDQDRRPIRLRDLLGQKTVVLYFYPRDATPGCTLEARAFRDSYEKFTAQGAEVVGVSSDSVGSHRRFAARQRLPFLLLSDRDGAVRELYGVEKTLGILPGRVTYVIDQAGVVRHVYGSQLWPTQHSRTALQVLDALSDGNRTLRG